MLRNFSADNRFFRLAIVSVSVIVFLFIKWQDIFLPYFWDELSGYMSGIIYMADHGISLHPAAVPPQMSYGHPLLMHACMAFVLKYIGSEPYVMHLTTLLFTFVLAVFTALIALHFSKDKTVAASAFAIFLMQPVVMAQSTQVVLEMFLAMHTMAAVFFYLKKKYFWSILFTCLGILTKETGLVLAIAFPVDILLRHFTSIDKEKTLQKLAFYMAPFLIFILFLLLQKQVHGWYLNPVNMGKSKLDILSMLQKIWDYPLEFSFVNQGRFVYTLAAVLLAIIYLIKYRSRVPSVNPDLVLILIFSFGFMLFSSIADTLERYFLMLIPFVACLFAFVAVKYGKLKPLYFPLILLIGTAANLLFSDNGKRYSEADLSYRHMIHTNRMVFDFVNSGKFKNDTVAFAFPLQYLPVDPRFGYYKEKHFISDTAFLPSTAIRVYNTPGNLDWNPPDTMEFNKIAEFSSGYSRSYVFERKKGMNP